MNKIFSFLLILMLFTVISCKEETVVMSAVKDGEELKEGALVPFLLRQNYPNPFNPSTSFRFEVYKEMRLQVKIFTEDWELVDILLDETKSPGTYVVNFWGLNDKGKALPSGIYYYTLEGDGLILTRQMTLLK